MMFRAFSFATALVLAALTPARAGDEPLTIKLVSEVRSIKPGQSFYVGLSLHHGAGWHSYWRFPGVVGVPTSIKWKDLPAGFVAEPIDWPEPESVLMFQIKAQGYERDVVLPIKITPPADLKPGTTVTLAGKAAYMCCSRECHPGFEDLSITLPVGADAVADAAVRDKIQRELATRPQMTSAWTASVDEGQEKMVLALKPGTDAAAISEADAAKLVYFTEDGLIDSDKPQQVERRADGSLVFTLVKTSYIVGGKPAKLTGVLVHPGGWKADGSVRCMRIEAPLAAK